METKHTHGPWSVNEKTNIPDQDRANDRLLGIYADGDEGRGGSFVAVVEGDIFERDEMQANARLIAAAPDLLQELQNIAEAKPSTWEPDMRDQFQAWAQSRARAAIAKAQEVKP